MTDTLTHTTPELATLPACTLLAIDGEGAPVGPRFEAAVGRSTTTGRSRGPGGPTRPAGLRPRPPRRLRWTLAVPVGAPLEHRPAQRVAWLVHHGLYEDEGPTLAALYAFVAEQGLTPAGPHTELYLTDRSASLPPTCGRRSASRSRTRPAALMPIGGLARLSRLTVKALRLYDTEGLLVPAWVDPTPATATTAPSRSGRRPRSPCCARSAFRSPRSATCWRRPTTLRWRRC